MEVAEVEKGAGKADLGFYIKSSVWDISSLKCLLDIHMEILSRQLDIWVEESQAGI